MPARGRKKRPASKRITPEQARRILAARQSRDPVRHFVHSPTQRSFFTSRASFRLLTGGNRSGKTATGLVELSMLARNIHPHRKPYRKLTIIAYAISRQQAAEVVQKKLFESSELPGFDDEPMIPAREVDWDESGSIKAGFRTWYRIVMKNGNRILFSWSDSEDTQKRIQGVQADYVFFDENAGSRKLLVESLMRLRDVRSAARRGDYGEDGWHAGGIIWCATATDINEGFDDFKEHCENPAEPDWALYYIPPGENPTVDENDEAINDFLTDEERAIRIHGTASAADLVRIYANQWDEEKHLFSEPLPHSSSDNIWLGYDPGMDHPTGLVFVIITKADPSTLNIVRYIRHNRRTMAEDAAAVAEFLQGRRLAGVVYDTVMKNTDKRGSSTLRLMKEEFAAAGITPLSGYFAAAKNHQQGITLVRRYLQPLRGGPPLLRFYNDVDSGVKAGLRELLNYRGKEATQFTGAGGVVKKNDEFPDCLRYLVMRRLVHLDRLSCGKVVRGAPKTPVEPEPPIPDTPYEKHLALSRQAQWRGRPRKRDIGARRAFSF